MNKNRHFLKLVAAKWWRILLYICVFVVLTLFIIELAIDLDSTTLHIIGIVDTAIWVIFLVDLTYGYSVAQDKKLFFRQNWLLILSMIPLTAILNSVRVVQGTRIVNAIEMGAKTEGIAAAERLIEMEPKLQAASAIAITPAVQAIKGTQMLAHWKHEGFFLKDRHLRVFTYIAPGVNRKVSDGIIKGVDEFTKFKLGLTSKYIEVKSLEEPMDSKGNTLHLIITKNALLKSEILAGTNLKARIVFATDWLADARNYRDSKNNLDYLKATRGTILAYNHLARLFNYEACNNLHCTFNFPRKDIDNLAFLYHLNREIPLCEKHKRWHY